MTLHVDVAADGVRVPLARARTVDLATFVLKREHVRHALLSISFVTNRTIATLNREHLGHRGPTDVITFALGDASADGPVVGDVYIAPDVARVNAGTHGRGIREELARLVVHGTLHVLGYEHPELDDRTASPMWNRQERLLAAWLRTADR